MVMEMILDLIEGDTKLNAVELIDNRTQNWRRTTMNDDTATLLT